MRREEMKRVGAVPVGTGAPAAMEGELGGSVLRNKWKRERGGR